MNLQKTPYDSMINLILMSLSCYVQAPEGSLTGMSWREVIVSLADTVEAATSVHEEIKSLRRKFFSLDARVRKEIFERAQTLYLQSFKEQTPSVQVLIQPIARWSDLETKQEHVIMYDTQAEKVYSCMTSRKGKKSRFMLERTPVTHLAERFRPLIY